MFEDGAGESHLISPLATWTDRAADSTLVHGITRAQLRAEGVPAAEVARRVHLALGSHDVYSDAPQADQIWLGVLMRTAGLLPLPVRRVYDSYRPLFRPLVQRLPRSVVSGLAQSIVMKAEHDVERVGGVRHRAEPDARRLLDTWLSVKAQVAEVLEGWP